MSGYDARDVRRHAKEAVAALSSLKAGIQQTAAAVGALLGVLAKFQEQPTGYTDSYLQAEALFKRIDDTVDSLVDLLQKGLPGDG